MKRAILKVTIPAVLAGCTTPQSNRPQADVNYNRQVASAQQAVEHAPAWMFELPKDPAMIYESATSTSTDFSMADMKARTIAYAKICHVAGGRVRSQTKLYRADHNASSSEQSEMAVRSICPDIDVTGVQTISLKHVAEGNMVRTYVLIGLPVGSSNVMKDAKEARKNAPDAFKELDALAEAKPASATSVGSSNSTQSLQLLNVDSEEYKRRRDEALQKPNSVIGHVTLDDQ